MRRKALLRAGHTGATLVYFCSCCVQVKGQWAATQLGRGLDQRPTDTWGRGRGTVLRACFHSPMIKPGQETLGATEGGMVFPGAKLSVDKGWCGPGAGSRGTMHWDG